MRRGKCREDIYVEDKDGPVRPRNGRGASSPGRCLIWD